jgi:ATP-dependent exoDNAse (exonuclease V) beta subunit
VALSVPDPYSDARVTNAAIATTVPPAVGAFLEWLFTASGWHVSSREVPGEQVPVAPGHVCLLFRRFDSLGVDVTRPYVEALEARSIPHLLVGGRSFHDRDEVETMRTALVALEWPDDELAVFGALRGSLFALSDETLFRYREAGGRWHPFHRAGGLPDELRPVQEALECLRDLHLGRNHRPIAETVSRLLDAARAHAGFALRNAGEQALANVLQIAEMARQYELNGGISFRGFVEQLRDDAGATRAEEAPVVEEGSDGVRLMTVHRAKGLEFPVVVLCDITAPLTTARPSRYLDPSAGLCAVRLAGWSPTELLEHEDEELEREASEGIRVAYVAATRARDLLVVPALADKPYEGGWVSPLNAALYPPRAERGQPLAAEGCPAFGRDGVVTRDGPRPSDSVTPGRYVLGDNEAPSPASYEVVWWDPSVLDLERAQAPGIRGEGLIAKDAPPLIVEEGLARFRAWQSGRDAAIREAARPTRIVRTVRQRAADEVTRQVRSARTVDVVDAMSDVGEARPGGPRFGALVHAALAVTPLAQDRAGLDDLLAVHARLLGAEPDEVASARRLVRAALAHPLLARAAAADRLGRCRRELPVAFADGHEVCEGVVDLAFEEADGWTIVDFKTDRAGGPAETLYEHQVALYAEAVARATGRPVRAVVLRV